MKQSLNQYLDCSFRSRAHRLRIVGVVKDRITISPLVFVAAAVLALVITAIMVGFQSVRSAMQNPVNSLRTD